MRPVADHLPSVDWIIETVLENVAEEGLLDEHGFEDFENACFADDVKAAAEAFRESVASKVKYRMADTLVATHEVTWDDNGDPLIDGEPLYTTSPPFAAGASDG